MKKLLLVLLVLSSSSVYSFESSDSILEANSSPCSTYSICIGGQEGAPASEKSEPQETVGFCSIYPRCKG